jgi:2,5-furandicarboxylate decarboxylase 1
MPTIDTERFRLRNLVERLVDSGECEVHDKPIDLIDIAAVLDGNPRAVLFKAAGPEKAELVGNVMGSRKRLANALGTDERNLLGTLSQRLNRLQSPIKVSSQQAPVQQVVLKDDEADLTALPVHLQPATTARRMFPPASITRCFPAPATPTSAAAASCCAARGRPAST